MADGIVQVAPDSTGKKMDTEELTVGANTVQRERVQISGAVAAAIAKVLNADPASADYGLVVRPIMESPARNKVWAYADIDSLKQEAGSVALKVALYGADGNPIALAHDAVDAGTSLKIGGKANNTPPAAVSAEGDRVNAWFDRQGRQAIFDAARETWCAYADAVAFANGKSHISIMNAAGSGKIVKVRKLFAVNLQTAAITGIVQRFNIQTITAHSGGTAVTPRTFDTNNAALPAQITVLTNGTLTGGTTIYPWITSSEEELATTPVSKAMMQQWMNIIPEGVEVQEHVLREGNGLAVLQAINSTVGSFGWILIFTVEPS